MTRTQTRLKAEAFFIENLDITFKAVAEHFGFSEKTIGTWARKYDWKDKRLDFHASPTRIKQRLQQEALRITNGEDERFKADAIAKLMSAIDRLNKRADPVVVHKILKDLDHFISETDPDFAKKCTQFHKQFLQHRINLEN